jgi:hypothetical protein
LGTLLICASVTRAGFSGGIDTFNGTTLDTSTWETFKAVPNEGYVDQNNQLNINSNRFGNPIEYTSRFATVGIGGSVTTDVTIPANARAVLALDSNSGGTTNYIAFDSALIVMNFDPGGPIAAWTGSNGNNSAASSVANVPGGQGSFKFRLSRTGAGTATAEAFSSTMTLLGSANLSFAGFPNDLHVSFVGENGTVSFDNVTLGGNFNVPEPACLAVLAPILVLGLRRRKA